jgi:hypothetical protein
MIVGAFPLENTSPLDGHYDLVPSYYGAGSFALWILTIISVIIVWLFHPRHALSRDTITAEFVGCLLYPVVAGSDVFRRVSQFGRSNEALWKTPMEPKLIAQVLAIQAPVKICDYHLLFTLLYTLVLLFMFFQMWRKDEKSKLNITRFPWRRSSCVWIVAAWCVLAEGFAGFHGSLKNLLLEAFGTSCVAYLAVGLVCMALFPTAILIWQAYSVIQYVCDVLVGRKSISLRDWTVSDACLIIFGYPAFSLFMAAIIWGLLFTLCSNDPWVRLLLPASNETISNLDQIISLLGGICLVGYRIAGAWPRQETKKKGDDISY